MIFAEPVVGGRFDPRFPELVRAACQTLRETSGDPPEPGGAAQASESTAGA